MARKLMTAKEKRAKNNAQQKAYRERNPELVDLWRQRSYARFLLQRGWRVEAPAGMKTPEEVRQKRDFMRSLPDGPIDWCDPRSYNFPPDPPPKSKGPIPDEYKFPPEDMPY